MCRLVVLQVAVPELEEVVLEGQDVEEGEGAEVVVVVDVVVEEVVSLLSRYHSEFATLI